MMKENYLDLVRQGESAETLHGIRMDAGNDPRLFQEEKDEICVAIQNKFAALNAATAKTAVKKGRWDLKRGPSMISRKVLPLFVFVAWSFIAASDGRCELSSGCQSLSPLFGRRLSALSMLESGNDDGAIGKAGEVSRFQIMPTVWRQYAGYSAETIRKYHPSLPWADPRNPVTASNVAAMVMDARVRTFVAKFHCEPNEVEFYLLWLRPASMLAHRGYSRVEFERAQRFSNLVNSTR